MNLTNKITDRLRELIPGDEMQNIEAKNNLRLIITKLGMDGLDDMYEYLDGTDTFFHYDTTKPQEQTDENYDIIEKKTSQ